MHEFKIIQLCGYYIYIYTHIYLYIYAYTNIYIYVYMNTEKALKGGEGNAEV